MNYHLFLQAAAPNNNSMLFILGAMILVFYFFMIRPQAKKAKDAKKFQENLQKGDKIVTIAGIHGTVNKVNEDGTISLEINPGIHGTVNKVNEDGTISLEINPGSYLKIEKSAISIEWSQQLNKPLVTDKKS